MLSFMAKGFFAESQILMFPVLALVIFCCVFTLVTYRTLRRDKSEIARLSRLPFEDEFAAHQAAFEAATASRSES